MGHLLFNERTLLGLIALAAWAFQKVAGARRRAAAAREGRSVVTGPHGEPVATADEAERTRRVQAEVARKIAERRILMMPAARLEPPPRPEPAPIRAVPPVQEFSPLAAAPRLPDYQAAMMALPPSPPSLPVLAEAAAPQRSGGVWLEELRQPATARRAILLQAIMGPPVGLRPD